MKELQNKIYKKYLAQNRIYGIMMELTHKCPCDCIHCLLVKNSKDELSLTEITNLFAQLRKEGVVNLAFSGGDPFMRPDLHDIIASAKKEQFFLSILSTGLLIDNSEAKFLKEMGIWNVELSILGAKPETHDKLMKYKGAFNKMMIVIDHLKTQNINISLKSMIMKPNFLELNEMSEISKKLKVNFSAGIAVSPRIDGNLSPLDYSLSAEEIAKLDLNLIGGGIIPGEEGRIGALLTCNAGKVSAGISPNGDIFPCIIMRNKLGNIRENSLEDIWHNNPSAFLNQLRNIKPEDNSECYSCNLKSFCTRCPGVAYLETGKLTKASSSACICARGIKSVSTN